ncbi:MULTISPECIES: M1 family metallopeptidase [Bradyrhizobium]|uniref:Aminopeptidase n=1 Tax=Bradyrhizobium elkanii TaxID=29448 RepID=A0A4U6S6P8_BRAEL|nr:MULTISPECIES: M1 family metallopeptidase [Bradyrhizobium]MTV16110.1 M1 family peptidase [Bradyrhizobium sp. BR2003]TKV81842.1 M1 family metallopeptidase [Bradyrhizobium elkanii]
MNKPATHVRRALLRRLATAIGLALAMAASAQAEQTFSFDHTPGKLPKTVVPLHYAIELTPDIAGLALPGVETVDVEVRETTAQLTLNAVNTTFAEVTIDDGAQRAEVATDATAQTATLTFAKPLAAGRHKLRIAFTAQINKFGTGLFSVDYPTRTGIKRMISSKLEPADARRIFPCWDEPSFKASFALTVVIPRNLLAVGNMPVTGEELVAGDLKKVAFAPTPKMSSYLFVLTVGELERVTADAGGVTVGVVTTEGKGGQGRFALDSAVKLLAYYNDYFGVKYPLPKLDLIAVPGGFGGAMENWGGITFFESRLLFDPATSAETARRGIFAIIAHEMAHMWFGDLVTMAWWDNLWLNEGFASWMATKASEQFYPEWQGWLNGYGAKQFAMTLDARRTSHPVQQPIADHSEAVTAFDAITYNKGQALIRMLENYLGEQAFRDGIRKYMAAHAYSNSTTADLWQALESSGGKTITGIAASFTEQAGVPLVVAEADCVGAAQRLALRQDRFVIAPANDPPLPARNWQIPVAAGPAHGKPFDEILLKKATNIPAGACGDAIKVNLGDVGYYRVEYGPKNRAALLNAFPQMQVVDRLNVVTDSWALVQAGRAEAPSYLALLDALDAGDHRAVWDQVISTFAALNRLSRGRTERPVIQAYARAKLRPVFDRIGWDGSGGDDTALLRASLISTLGDVGDAAIVAEAKRRFAAFADDPNSLPTALRDAVTHVVGVTADRATYDQLLALARSSTATNERLRYYLAAASARDAELARATLALTLTSELPDTIVTGMINAVASAGEQPQLAWDFVRTNFDTLLARQGPNFRDQFVPNFMTNFTDEAHAVELAAFAPSQSTTGGRVMVARSVQAIAISADLAARVLPAADAWIRAHKP